MGPLEQVDACAGSCRGCERLGSCPDRVVCRCLKVTEHDVISAIVTLGVRSLTDLQRVTEAGSGCTCCRRELANYLAVYSPSESPVICSVR